MAPDIERLVRPPEHTLQAEFGGQNGSVAGTDERIELQVLWCIFVVEQLSQLVVRNVLFATNQFRGVAIAGTTVIVVIIA